MSSAAWITGGSGRGRAGWQEQHQEKQWEQQTGAAKASVHGSEHAAGSNGLVPPRDHFQKGIVVRW